MPDPVKDLAQLLANARAGSPEALGTALDACRLYLLGIADREIDGGLRAKGGASDVVQDTFLEAQRDFAAFQGQDGADLRAWLRRMLLNNINNFARHYRGTDKRRLDREIALQPPLSTSGATPGPAADTPSPSRQIMAGEEVDELRLAMARLPDDYRQLLRLRYEDERSFEEIGQAMNRTSNAVRKLWARAVERLQQELDNPP